MDKYTDPVRNLGSKISVDDAIFQIKILTEIVAKSIFSSFCCLNFKVLGFELK